MIKTVSFIILPMLPLCLYIFMTSHFFIYDIEVSADFFKLFIHQMGIECGYQNHLYHIITNMIR